MSSEDRVYIERKVKFMAKIDSLITEYSRVFIVYADNVGSKQMQQIRLALRGHGVLLMGKNTMIRNALNKRKVKNPNLGVLKDLITENIGLVFTHEPIAQVKSLILENRVPAQAKVGGIAPVDVTIPAGPTSLDPGQTSFFQALNISTKLSRGEIEILSPYTVVKAGEPVNASVAALLQKLKITPFTYGLEIKCVYDNGTVFEPAVLDITDDNLISSFLTGVSNIAAISMQIKYPTLASLPHIVANGYKNVLAAAFTTKYSFPALEKMRSAPAAPAAAKAAPAKSSAEAAPAKKEPEKKAEPAPKKKEPEPEPEDDGGGMMDLFG